MTSIPEVSAFFHEPTATVTYLVADSRAQKAVIIDPVLDFDPASGKIWTASIDAVLDEANRLGWVIQWILETHAHADHLSGAQRVKARTQAPIVIGAHITEVQALFAPRFHATDVSPDGSAFDRLVKDGDELSLGDLAIKVLHTPGHTPACVTYAIGDAAFVGDTLFMPDYGTARTDFPGGDAATLYRSIHKIFELPLQTRIFVGHDYLPAGRTQYAWETSLERQRAENVQIKDKIGEAAFVSARNKRDAGLAPPRLLLPSLQVNIRAGHLPPADDDGIIRLRIPVNVSE